MKPDILQSVAENSKPAKLILYFESAPQLEKFAASALIPTCHPALTPSQWTLLRILLMPLPQQLRL